MLSTYYSDSWNYQAVIKNIRIANGRTNRQSDRRPDTTPHTSKSHLTKTSYRSISLNLHLFVHIGASILVATKRLFQIDRCDGDGDGDGDNVSVRGPYSIASCFFSAN